MDTLGNELAWELISSTGLFFTGCCEQSFVGSRYGWEIHTVRQMKSASRKFLSFRHHYLVPSFPLILEDKAKLFLAMGLKAV